MDHLPERVKDRDSKLYPLKMAGTSVAVQSPRLSNVNFARQNEILANQGCVFFIVLWIVGYRNGHPGPDFAGNATNQMKSNSWAC